MSREFIFNIYAFAAYLLFSFLYLSLMFSPSLFDLNALEWALGGDSAMHLVGLNAYLLSDSRTLNAPLTMLGGFEWSTVFFSDSIPLVGALIKPFFNKDIINPYGFWILISISLNGWISFLICRRILGPMHYNNFLTIGFGIIMCINSVILIRTGFFDDRFSHFALVGFWVVLVSMYGCLNVMRGNSLVGLILLTVGSFLASFVHPYFAMMCMGIIITFGFFAIFQLSPYRMMCSLLGIFLSGLAISLSFYILGAFEVETSAVSGYGRYKASILSLFDSNGFGILSIKGGFGNGEHEGFGFVPFICLLTIFLSYKKYKIPKDLIIDVEIKFFIVVFFVFLVGSWSVNIGHGSFSTFLISEAVVPDFIKIFRAGGRLMMVVNFSLILLAIWMIVKFRWPKVIAQIFVFGFLIETVIGQISQNEYGQRVKFGDQVTKDISCSPKENENHYISIQVPIESFFDYGRAARIGLFSLCNGWVPTYARSARTNKKDIRVKQAEELEHMIEGRFSSVFVAYEEKLFPSVGSLNSSFKYSSVIDSFEGVAIIKYSK